MIFARTIVAGAILCSAPLQIASSQTATEQREAYLLWSEERKEELAKERNRRP